MPASRPTILRQTCALISLLAPTVPLTFAQQAAQPPTPPAPSASAPIDSASAPPARTNPPPSRSGRNASLNPEDPLLVVLPVVDFRGGTVRDFVEALRTALDPKPLNVALAPSLGDVPLEAIRLHNITPSAALSLLSTLGLENGVSISTTPSVGQQDFAIVSLAPATQMTSRMMFERAKTESILLRELIAERPGEPAGAGDKRKRILLAAIEQALSTANTSVALESRADYHEESGVLFLRAPEKTVEFVRQTVYQLADSWAREEQDRNQAAPAASELDAATRANADLTRQLEIAIGTAKEPISLVVKMPPEHVPEAIEALQAVLATEHAAGEQPVEITRVENGVSLRGTPISVGRARLALLLAGEMLRKTTRTGQPTSDTR